MIIRKCDLCGETIERNVNEPLIFAATYADDREEPKELTIKIDARIRGQGPGTDVCTQCILTMIRQEDLFLRGG